MLQKIWKNEEGGLVLEWIFLFTVLVIGIVGGIVILRDAVIIEAGETAGAAMALNTNYEVTAPPTIQVPNETGTLQTVTVIKEGFGPTKTVKGNVTISVDENND